MRIVILTGGFSDEREVSLTSAKNVKDALRRKGYKVKVYDLMDGWEYFKFQDDDVVFPVIHGKEGEGGDLQKELEKRNLKFVGSPSRALKKGWEKIPFKHFCEAEGIVTPKWQVIKRENWQKLDMNCPIVIKPSDNGSSIDLYLVDIKSELDKIPFDVLFNKYDEFLVEKFIKGVEVTCGILEDKALPLLEIVPPDGEMFDYDNKYNGKTKEIPFAPSVPEDIQRKVQEIALNIFKGLGCKDYARIDFIVKGEDIYALEINTIPGLTSESLFPKEAKAIGISFDELMDRLIKMQLD